jgi:hypothetical protein
LEKQTMEAGCGTVETFYVTAADNQFRLPAA